MCRLRLVFADAVEGFGGLIGAILRATVEDWMAARGFGGTGEGVAVLSGCTVGYLPRELSVRSGDMYMCGAYQQVLNVGISLAELLSRVAR